VSQAKREPVSFLVFFLIWAEYKGWTVPLLHVRVCQWMDETHQDPLRVLQIFRGAGKSTLLAIYNAWRYYKNPAFRILHQGDQDGTAYKTSRDTKAVLMRHPLTREDFAKIRGDVKFWWTPESEDERNPSMQAAGIMSNITSSRADEAQNDDVEVPRNIRTPEAREQLRYRLSEQTHILVPGSSTLYIGTPHTHDSIYDEQIKAGATVLKIPMFAHERRYEEKDTASETRFAVPSQPGEDGLYVFVGIGKFAKLLEEGKDYRYRAGFVEFSEPPGAMLDIYTECAWPERFDRRELALRRRKCFTIGEWDSQYQLHSKPITDVRLDPDRMIAYDVEPVIRSANGETMMFLGKVRLVGVSAWWDCATGKIDADDSAFSIVFTDDAGRLYWHVDETLLGELAEFDDVTGKINGGQLQQIRELVIRYQIPNVHVEVNGAGGMVVPILRRALAGTGCGVLEEVASVKKNKRILDAFEPVLSTRYLWAHTRVLDGPASTQMREFNPKVTEQPDDHIDAGAGAIACTPVRIGKIVGKPTASSREDWVPSAGVHEVELDY
jgi:hypothetical protein